MTDDMTIRFDSEEYVLRKDGEGLQVGRRNGSEVAWLETVDVELHSAGHVLAAVNTVLDVDQEGEAEQLAREIADKLESGELEPTASAIEPLADTLR